MPFKFFGRKPESAPTPAPADPSDQPDAIDEEGDEGIPEDTGGAEAILGDWRLRAAAVIPGGASTGSKRPSALYGEHTDAGAAHYLRASGCTVVTAAEESLVDCTMALGAVSLGYADDAVTRAVISAIAAGPVSGLSHVLEVEIAERLCEVIPCAERVRFLKTGAEGVSAAVRIARAATGRRQVIACGYFGWHDWSNEGPGILAEARAHVTRVTFNDVAGLEQAVRAAGSDLAAVLIEPVVEALPAPEWIARARALCDASGAVLVFDEMKTGFRLALGGYQEYGQVVPDVAVFGKAMANGYPIAAVVGRAGVMEGAARTWISSTTASEAGALAAVGAVLDRYAEGDVCDTLWRVGAQMRQSLDHAIAASGAPGVTVHGVDPMWFVRFEDPALESRFVRRASDLGVLFKRGAYNYAAVAHDDDDILLEVERVASSALVDVLEGVDP